MCVCDEPIEYNVFVILREQLPHKKKHLSLKYPNLNTSMSLFTSLYIFTMILFQYFCQKADRQVIRLPISMEAHTNTWPYPGHKHCNLVGHYCSTTWASFFQTRCPLCQYSTLPVMLCYKIFNLLILKQVYCAFKS